MGLVFCFEIGDGHGRISKEEKTYGVQHVMKELSHRVETNVYGREKNGSHTAKDQKPHSGAFGVGVPFVLFLQVDERVDREAHLCYREREDDSKEHGNVPGDGPFGTISSVGRWAGFTRLAKHCVCGVLVVVD